MLVNDPALAARLRQLRNGGQSSRYRHESFGVNSRLDELQAAILRVSLAAPRRAGPRGDASWRPSTVRELAGTGLVLHEEQPYARAVYHLFVVRHPRRDALLAALAERGIGTLIHYPIPLHLQPAFAGLGRGPASCPSPSGRPPRSCRCRSTRSCATSRRRRSSQAVRDELPRLC